MNFRVRDGWRENGIREDLLQRRTAKNLNGDHGWGVIWSRAANKIIGRGKSGGERISPAG